MRANWEADWRDKTSGTFCYQIQSRISYSVVRFHWGSRHLNSSSDGLYSIQPDKLTNRESSQTPAPMEDGRSPASRNREHIQSEHVQTPPSRCYLQRAPLQCSTSLPEWSRGIRCYRWKIFRSIFQEGVNRREERKREREREREKNQSKGLIMSGFVHPNIAAQQINKDSTYVDIWRRTRVSNVALGRTCNIPVN